MFKSYHIFVLYETLSIDYESYNILREEVYEEKFCYSLRRF